MTESGSASASATSDAARGRSRVPIVLAVLLVLLLVVLGGLALAQRWGGSDSEVSIGLIAEPQNLDIRSTAGVPLDQILVDNVYEGLIGLETGTIDEYRPVLATALPDVSDDGLVYTFELREGVRFHSGEPLEPADVVDSLERTLTEDLLGDGGTAEVSAEGRTISIALSRPNTQLMWHLAGRAGLVFDEDDAGELADRANGTGPYRLDEWRRGEQLTLVRDDGYWGEAPEIETAVFRFFPDGREAVTALQEGDLDVHTALLPSLRPEFEDDESFTMVRASSSDVFTLGFNTERAPLDDPKVREAISRAIDSEALIASQNGDGKAIGGPITELEPGFEDLTGVNDYDPEGARELLDEAGQTGLSLTLTAPVFYDTAPLDLITSQLADVGISVSVKTVDFATWLEQVYTNHDYQLSYIDHAEARDFGNYANPDYYFGYDDPEVQRLYARSLQATSAEEEDRLLADAARRVAEDAPAKWLYNYTPTNVVSDRVTGFPAANTNARIPLRDVGLAE